MRHLALALLFLALLGGREASAQSTPSIDPAQRQEAMRALHVIRAELAGMPAANDAAKQAADDSVGVGVVAGIVQGPADPASAWVLVVAARLLDNPTAWQLVPVDADGAYRAMNLSPGEYYLMAGADGYQAQFFRQSYDLFNAEQIPVGPDLVMEGIDFFLEPLQVGSGAIEGTVFAADGATPLARAEVVVYPRDQPYRGTTVTTDADGTYRIDNLYAGNYIVEAWAAGYFHQFYDGVERMDLATAVPVGSDATVSGIDFRLERSGSISGTVSSPDGSPIPNASIYVQTDFTMPPDSMYIDPIYWAGTDEEGRFTVTGLSAGQYLVQAQAYGQWFTVYAWYDGVTRIEDATPVAVENGRDTPGIDFELDLVGTTGSISGTVTTADGEPAREAYLRLEPFSDVPIYLSAFARTDENGTYTFENIPVGSYRVALDYWTDVFYTTIWYDQVYRWEEATPVDVQENETTAGIDFTLPRADGVIEGRVVDQDGHPVAGAYVFSSPGSYVYPMDIGFGMAFGMTDSDGRYTIQRLIDGEYYVWTSSCLFWQCIERWWPDSPSFVGAEPVVLKDGMSDPAEVDFKLPLTQGAASISGTVHHVDGRALAGAYVTVSWASDAARPDDPVWYAEQQTQTDSLGAYRFDYLPAGTYTVNASYWEEGGYAAQWFDGADTPADATPIELADGDVRDEINFKLDVRSIYGTLAGVVTFDDNTPAGGAYVEVSPYYWDYAAWPINPVPYYTLTLDSGEFEIAGLPNGTYFVNVFAQGGRMIENIDPAGVSGYIVEIVGGETTRAALALMRVEEGEGAIAGQVTTQDSVALDFAIVQAMVDDDPNRIFTAIADTRGAYEFAALPEGEYVVWSFAPYHALEYFDDTYEPSDATRLSVRNGAQLAGIDFDLMPVYYRASPEDDGASPENSSYIFGQVTDASGDAIDGATVYALNASGDVLSSVRTHADGMYEIAGVTPGAGIRLKAAHPGYASRFHDGAATLDAAANLELSAGRFEINFALVAGTSVGVDRDPELPAGIALRGNYPNPFNPETQIAFSVAEPMTVTVTIYDALGRRVTELFRGAVSAGDTQLRWDATGSAGEAMPSGIYFYRIEAQGSAQTGTMTLLR
ncbi:MAG: carboxypeptidase regulatory-like domain-containing protein [Rhodothermales bacterium]